MRGEYSHTIDAKGRLTFPVKLREELGERFMVSKWLENTLIARSVPEWEKFEDMINQQPIAKSRKLRRFFASAVECEPDAQGKILIPKTLRDYAGLCKDVTILGMRDSVEIWDTGRWNAYNSDMDSDSIADAMEEMGI